MGTIVGARGLQVGGEGVWGGGRGREGAGEGGRKAGRVCQQCNADSVFVFSDTDWEDLL